MSSETTRHLEEKLKKIDKQEDVSSFIRSNGNNDSSFREFYSRYIGENHIEVPEILKKSCVSRNYIYNILNGDREPNRDKILALCIAAGMTFAETDRALEIAGKRRIYPKDERDARIAIMINQGVKNVEDINMMLDSYGLEPLK